jgi:hypothetical protein
MLTVTDPHRMICAVAALKPTKLHTPKGILVRVRRKGPGAMGGEAHLGDCLFAIRIANTSEAALTELANRPSTSDTRMEPLGIQTRTLGEARVL